MLEIKSCRFGLGSAQNGLARVFEIDLPGLQVHWLYDHCLAQSRRGQRLQAHRSHGRHARGKVGALCHPTSQLQVRLFND
jgi:hypothetical protein